jgi:hypothetical protein
MGKRRDNFKKPLVLSHRLAQYDKALDLLIAGEDMSPEYVKIRADKVKDIRG